MAKNTRDTIVNRSSTAKAKTHSLAFDLIARVTSPLDLSRIAIFSEVKFLTPRLIIDGEENGEQWRTKMPLFRGA